MPTAAARRDPRTDHFLADWPLRAHAATRPERIALIVGEERLSYRALDARVDAAAARLRAAGAGRGDRVLVALDNGLAAVIAFYAALRADAVPSLLGAPRRPRHVARVAALAEPGLLVAEAPVDGVAAPLVTPVELLAAPPGEPPARAAIDLDLATLCWTSGSTGEPKGVMLTHGHLRHNAATIGAYLEHTADDVVLCVLPLSHSYGLFQLLVTHAFGGTLVLERGFTLAPALLERLAALGVTGFAGVPTIFASILALRHPEAFPLPALRYLTCAAGALPAAHLRRLGELFPAARVFAMYGQTECTRISYLPPELAADHPGSVGIAVPNEEAYVVDAAGAPVAPGEVGELVVRGAHVMRGYWRDPEATARVLRPGRYPGEVVLHTGDLFRLDDDGLLHFVARRDEVIKTRGEKVALRAVEAVIGALPGVLECAVIGVPDARHGAVVKAAVVLRPGHLLSIDDIKRAVRAELDDAAVPSAVELRDELPRSETGKLLRGALA